MFVNIYWLIYADYYVQEAACESIEPDAVPVIATELLRRAASVMARCVGDVDPRPSCALLSALSRATDHANNAPPLALRPVLDAVSAMCVKWEADPKAMDAASAFFRALSIQRDTALMLRRGGVVPLLVRLLSVHRRTLLPLRPRDLPKNEDGLPILPVASPSTKPFSSPVKGSATTTTSTTDEPRIAQFAVQALANMACDQTPDPDASLASLPRYDQAFLLVTPGMPGGVARIVIADGVEAIKTVMETHLDRPRILEDALCALSNMAFATDGEFEHLYLNMWWSLSSLWAYIHARINCFSLGGTPSRQ